MKKLVSLLLVFALALSLAVPALAEEPSGTPEPTAAPVENELVIVTPPHKTAYTAGESFDASGMRLRVNSTDGAFHELAASDKALTITPAGKLAEGQTSVTVIYKGKGGELSASQPITVSAVTTPEPTPTPAPQETPDYSGEAPFIAAYAATDAGGGELTSIKKNDTFTMVFRIVDNALAAYGDVDARNVAARLNTADFTYTGLAEVSQFDSGLSEGKPYCSYVLIFRDVIYNGGGNTFTVDISYEDTTRPVKTVSQVVGMCESGEVRSPGLIVRDVNYGGASIAAGKDATLSLSIFATTGTESLNDVMVSLGLPEGITLAGGSQTAYLGAMSSGAMRTASFKILPGAAFVGGVANITVDLSATGAESGAAVTASSSVSIPVLQPERFEITKVESPDTMMTGEENFISVTFVNKGKTSVDNLSAEISGENLANPGQSQFLGNIAPGTENSVDFDISAMAAGVIKGVITLSYEDATGAVKTVTQEYSITVEDMPPMDPGMMDPGMMDPMDPGMMEEPQGGLPGWGIALIVVAVAAAAVVVIRVVVKKRKAAALAALGDEDEDL